MSAGQHQILFSYAAAEEAGALSHASADMETGASTLAVVLADCEAGGSVVVSVHWYDASQTAEITGITCSGESALTVQGTPLQDAGSGFNYMQIATLANLSGGGSKTITVTFDETLANWAAHIKATHFPASVVDAADMVEAIGTDVGPNNISGQTTASASATSTAANSVLYFAGGTTFYPSPAGAHFTPGAGYTELSESTPDFYAYGGAYAGYNLDAGTAGTESGSVTFGDEDNWMAILLIMNPA
jgi:hypothetical protein